MLYKNHISQSMGKVFCVEFQRVPLKFHTKYLTHTLKNVDFIHRWQNRCPVGHVTTKVYVSWDKIYMPRARLNVEPCFIAY